MKRLVSGMLVVGFCVVEVDRLQAEDELVLAAPSVDPAPIVVFENAPPKTRRATDDLAEYIEKVSGARPEVVEGRPDPLPQKAIWVGYQPVLQELFPGVDFDFKHPEEILIAANDAHLVIAGRDRWDPDHLVVEVPHHVRNRPPHLVNGIQQEYGSCNAVYTFIQDYLGVRWLWPGKLGEDVIENDTIAFEPFEYRYHPQIRNRAGILAWSSVLSFRGRNIGPARQWTRFQRLQLDSLTMRRGHPFHRWWERFHKTNPDFFALQPDGTRGGGEPPWPDARCVKLCTSNPEVWAQILADIEAELAIDPNRNVFSVSQNDAAYSGYCICENCLAWDHPDQERVRYSWRGIAQEYLAQSDRMVTFANTIAGMLRERFPERDDMYIVASTYGNAHPVPIEVVPDDNVMISIFANIHNRPFAESGRGTRQNLADWARSGAKHIRWGANMGRGAGWQHAFPNVAPRRVIDDLRFVAEHNVMGVGFDTMWEHWINQGVHYYMLAQMAWNPYADGEAILADYYARAFGPASESMAAYWELMDETSEQIIFTDKTMDAVWPGDPDAEFYRRASGLLDRAAEALADADALYAKRVAYVRAGFDYFRLFRHNQQLIARLEAVRGEDADALSAARANWQQIVEIWERYADFNAFGGWIRPRDDGHGILEEGANPDRRGRTWE